MADRVGLKLGNYRLVSLLGEGSFAEVYLGEHLYLGTQAAIKVLHTRLARDDIEQFRQEARTIARLEHPHIIRVLDFGVDGTTPFLVMSHASNGTLRKRYPRGTRVPLANIVSYVRQVADALYYAHTQKLIHRDIKPENLLIGSNNEILLGDFGIALIAQSTKYQGTYDMAGTITYMAPEQIQSHPRPASDQYSLGIVVYEWLSGDRPFSGSFMEIVAKHSFVPPPPLRERLPTISPEVEQVVTTALAKDPEQRFATVKAFANALAQASGFSFNAGSSPGLSPQTAYTGPSENQAQQKQPITLAAPPDQVKSSSTPTTSPDNARQPVEPGTLSDRPVTTPIQPQTTQRIMSRRAVVMGLAGLAGAGAVGSLAWYLSVHGTQSSSPGHSDQTPPAVTVQSPTLSSQGSMFGYDAGHTRFNPQEHTLAPGNVSRLVPIPGWKAAATGGIVSSPVVANGIVYVGSWDKKLYAFSATMGALQWSASATDAIDSSPAVAGGIVYIGSQDSRVYAFDARTGVSAWIAPTITGGSIDFSSPVVANGILYIGSHDHKLYALDAKTGALVWTALTDDAIWSSPAVANGIVYISSRDTKLHAFDARTGSFLWSASLGIGSDSSPAVANGIVYAGSYDHKLYAFDAKTGTPAWSSPFSTGNGINASPAIAHGVVYVGSSDYKLYALDAKTGQPVWAAPATTGGAIESSPAVANGIVYVGSDDHKVYAFDATTGKTLWSASTGASIFSSPTVSNGILYIGSKDFKLYAFKLPGT